MQLSHYKKHQSVIKVALLFSQAKGLGMFLLLIAADYCIAAKIQNSSFFKIHFEVEETYISYIIYIYYTFFVVAAEDDNTSFDFILLSISLFNHSW